MRLRHCLVGGGLMLATIVSFAQSRPFDISIRDDLVSILANNAPVNELTQALAAETGVVFTLTGEKTTPVTVEIIEEPLEKAVAKISPNYLLVRENEAIDAALVEVVLMMDEGSNSGAGGAAEFLPSGAPAEELVPDTETMNPELAEQVPLQNGEPPAVDDAVPNNDLAKGALATPQ